MGRARMSLHNCAGHNIPNVASATRTTADKDRLVYAHASPVHYDIIRDNPVYAMPLGQARVSRIVDVYICWRMPSARLSCPSKSSISFTAWMASLSHIR